MRIEQLKKYHQFHQKRRKQLLNDLEQRRQRILGEMSKIADILKKNGASKAIVFGSILSTKHFHSKSDLDLLTFNLPLSQWLPTLTEIEELDNISDLEIDLKRAEELPEDFVAFTNKTGQRIL